MLKINFYPFPVLETKRLILRRIDLNDATAIFLLKSNPKTMEFIPKPLVKTIDEALKHIAIIDSKIKNNEGINWAITLKGNSKLIGIIGNYKIKPENYRCEIGYMLMPEFSGKGIISEAINKVLDYSFTILQMHSIEAIIDPGNHASERVLQKNGFVKEAHFKENEFFKGKFLDTVIYSLLKKDYK